MSMTKKSMLSNMLQFLRMLLKDCLTRVENLRFWRPIRLRSERIILHSKNRLLRHTTKLKLPRKHCSSMQKRSDLTFATFGWLFHAGVIGVLTDKFIGVKMCLRAHFFVQNRCKKYSRTCKVLNRYLLLKNQPKCRVIYNLVGANCPGINRLQRKYLNPLVFFVKI